MSQSRHRSSSNERGRSSAGRDTNSNDSHALRCRVFVGNLSNDNTSKTEIEEIFEKFGEVASCSLHNNYGFVQYYNDKDADLAVTEMHGKVLYGKRIDVNLAGLRRKPQSKDQYEGAPPKEDVVPADMLKIVPRPPRNRDRSPIKGEREQPYGRPAGSFERNAYDSYQRPQANRPIEYPGEHRMEPYGTFDRRDDMNSPYVRDYRDVGYRQNLDDSRPMRQQLRPAVDCEIVSLSKEETRYAEEVESRLRSIGLVCNIGFPPSELPILELMDRIARTGTLYAVVVTSQNAQHRSCTLNILHGTRQEHRNMPLDDALSFMARNFDSYLRSPRDPVCAPAYLPRDNARPAAQQNPTSSYASSEKQMSDNEIEAMITKLKKEKEDREAANPKPPSDHGRHAELGSQLREEQPLAAGNSYSYNNYAPPPAQGQNSNGAATTLPSSEGYFQQQNYEQPLYR